MPGTRNWIPREISNLALKIEFSVPLEKLRIIGDMTTFFLSISHCMQLQIKVCYVVAFSSVIGAIHIYFKIILYLSRNSLKTFFIVRPRIL